MNDLILLGSAKLKTMRKREISFFINEKQECCIARQSKAK